MPNKLLARVPADHAQGPAKLADAAKNAATARLQEYRDVDVLAELRRDRPGVLDALDLDLLVKHVDQFLEFYAAWHPYDDATAGGYKDGREQVELLLAGRKALRDFGPAIGNDGRLKSSLDPSRESVLLANDARVRSALHLNGAEQLDGVSLVKRLAEKNRFVSTARVAIDPFIRRLAAAGRTTELDELKRLAGLLDGRGTEWFDATRDRLDDYAPFPYDTQLFYDDGRGDKEIPDEATANAFFKHVEDVRIGLGIGELPRYYAVVAADGDGVGATISGLPTKEAHQGFSARLAMFAADVAGITKTHNGALIYSGGDDVLAFVPLDKVLCYVDALRTAFAQTVNQGGIGGLTLSVGVAIVHYGAHLQNALAWARDAENEAKGHTRANGDRKNALAIALHTASGGKEATTAVHGWDDEPVTDRWLRWVTWHRRGLIPDKAAFELRDLVREFKGLGELGGAAEEQEPDDRDGRARARDVLRREVQRILIRKEPGGAKLHEDEIGDVLTRIGTDLDGLDRLVNELLIARRIARAADVANGPWAKDQPVCAGNVRLTREPEEPAGGSGRREGADDAA